MQESYCRRKGERNHFFNTQRSSAFSLLLLAVVIVSVLMISSRLTTVRAAGNGGSATYLSNNSRYDYNGSETIINPASAPRLKLHWSFQAQGGTPANSISVQPIEANGMIYWGSWDGNEYATSLNGTTIWQQNIGYMYNSQCNSTTGITSTATVASLQIGGQLTSVLFVAGGDDNFYALNANSGSVIWKTALGTPPNDFLWSSPALYNGNIYIGLASFGDCPLVQGKMYQLNAATGAITHSFSTVPNGCIGGGVSGSPTIDQATNTLYFATGNQGTCSTKETYAPALVALRASDLSVIGSWLVPPAQQTQGDSDFINTPTLFQAQVKGAMRRMVGIANKNGIYYAFDRTAVSKGPLWSLQIAGIGGGCGPRCGDGSVSPSGWNGKALFVAGGQTTIGGQSCKGSLRALNPSSGKITWADCFNDGPVLSAVYLVPGLAIVGEGYKFVIVATSNGQTLYTYADGHKGSYFYGAASISGGVLYIGNFDGILYAFGS